MAGRVSTQLTPNGAPASQALGEVTPLKSEAR